MNQSEVAKHLDLSTRAYREMLARGELDKTADVDTQRTAYIRKLRQVAAGRAVPDGDLNPSAERALLDRERRRQLEMKNHLSAGELYERAPTLQAFRTTIAVFAEQVRAIPDMPERRAGLSPAQAEIAADEIDTQLEAVKARLLEQLQPDA